MSPYPLLRRSAAALLTAALAGVAVPGPAAVAEEAAPGAVVAGTPATQVPGDGVYVVTLVGRPAASYSGSVPGLTATRPTAGERFDRTRPEVAAYRQRLLGQQDRILDAIGGAEVLYRYTTAVNGFAARLDAGQVKQLRVTPGVALVERSVTRPVDMTDTADALGVDAMWKVAGGPDKAGRGQVIGVVDTGIWPENPSFAGLPQDIPGTAARVPGFHGACTKGESWDPGVCSSKLVSARYFVKGFGAGNLSRAEYLSPRDGTGHGSHTAAVAAGNDDVRVRIEGQDFGETTGIAPGARIAAYKACWAAPDPDDDGCTTADTVAAVDAAVADGVDVLNVSVSGPGDTVTDSVELAFLHATAAGVFVAASAGNRGPGASTVGHASPWVTTVGASTHQRLQGAVALGDGNALVGAMAADRRVPETGIVLGSAAAAPGASTDEARLCELGALDAREVQDNIVVCDRGTTARVDKSVAVARAGGVGMVLANVVPDTVDADVHSVPTVHLDVADAGAVRAYVRDTEDPTASIDPTATDGTPVPQIADFSSRGPSTAGGGDLLKPDLTAPGVSVLAAVAPPSSSGHLWDLTSGTSMSAPHVAGLAALVAAERPDWSPAETKSALMTTADDLAGTASPFAEGAGQVDPGDLLDPGLVLDAGHRDYLRFLSGQGFTYSDGSPVAPRGVDAGRLNLPSIAVGALVGTTRVVRTVTNVSGAPETFSPRVSGLGGVEATVRPRTLALRPGETGRFAVTFRVEDGAQLGSFAKGRLTWTGLTHQVRLPVVVRPEAVEVPAEVTGSLADGAVEVDGVAGSSAAVPVEVSGLVDAVPSGVSLQPGRFDPQLPRTDADTAAVPLTVPGGTEALRVQLEGHRAADDMDVYLYRDGVLTALATGKSSDETLTLVEPPAGDYTAYVVSASAANGTTTTGQLYTWVLPPADAGNLTGPGAVAAAPGQSFGFRLTWTDELSPTSRWFGVVRYGDSDRRTLVSLR